MAENRRTSGNGREVRLTENGIYVSALALIDAHGIDGLTMRKLAATLGVNPMSLYHHVANRAAVLDGVMRLTAASLRLPTPADGSWQDRLRLLANAFRDLSRAHRDLVRYAFTSPDIVQRESPLWQSLREILADAGVPADDLEPLAAVLVSLVSGLLLTEASAMLTSFSSGEDPFEAAVAVLIAGVQARLRENLR